MSGRLITSNIGWFKEVFQYAQALRGYDKISLTEYTTANAPYIKAGSLIEVDGSLFEFTTDTEVENWGITVTNQPVYIRMRVQATTPVSLIPEATTIAPVWNQWRAGWYEQGTSNRYTLYGADYSSGTSSANLMTLQNSPNTNDSWRAFKMGTDGFNRLISYDSDFINGQGVYIARLNGWTNVISSGFNWTDRYACLGIDWLDGDLILAEDDRIYRMNGFSQSQKSSFYTGYQVRNIFVMGGNLYTWAKEDDTTYKVRRYSGFSSTVSAIYDITVPDSLLFTPQPTTNGSSLITVVPDGGVKIRFHSGFTNTITSSFMHTASSTAGDIGWMNGQMNVLYANGTLDRTELYTYPPPTYIKYKRPTPFASNKIYSNGATSI